MCGIAGAVSLASGARLPREALDRMVDSMRLRGPDDRGVAEHTRVSMGMRRLSIIDLEGGHQPMESEDGAIRVVMNGEIYSFPELREQLVGAGHPLRTHSDTEVLVYGYLEWGLDGLLARLNGMFAFALHDLRRDRVFLVRDRMGIKPLVYAERDGLLLFGSSLRALLASGRVAVEPDPQGVRLFLHNQFIPAPHTAIRGVHKLPPACVLEIREGARRAIRRYWSIPEETDETRSPEAWAEELRALLADAVRVHMVSDVEVGAFLSGGVDSSIVVGLMAQVASRPVRAFSIGFPKDSGFDETDHSRQAAQRFGVRHELCEFTPAHVEELAHSVIAHLDEPLGDAACLPTYQLSADAGSRLKVVLTGEGADELFAGYEYYSRLPPRRPHGRRSVGRRGLGGLFDRLPGRSGRRPFLGRRFGSKSRWSGFPFAIHSDFVDLLVPDFVSDDTGGTRAQVDALESTCLSADPRTSRLGQALRVDSGFWLPDDLLMKVDRMTMAHSLEARVPFLDYRVVELAMRMPAHVKWSGSRGKVVLRSAFRELIGDDLAYRGKHGFNLPLADWFRGRLRPLLRQTLVDSKLEHVPWLRPDAIAAVLEAHEAGRGNFSRPLWMLVVLSEWFRVTSSEAVR